MDEFYILPVLAFLAGLILGGGLMYAIRARPKPAVAVEPSAEESPSWWLRRKGLSGSQLQLLQFIETEGDTNLDAIQKRFTKVPDRELFYRMEQIHLLGFVEKERDANTVTFRLTPDYAEAVAALMDDKTVILPPVS